MMITRAIFSIQTKRICLRTKNHAIKAPTVALMATTQAKPIASLSRLVMFRLQLAFAAILAMHIKIKNKNTEKNKLLKYFIYLSKSRCKHSFKKQKSMLYLILAKVTNNTAWRKKRKVTSWPKVGAKAQADHSKKQKYP